MMKELDEITPGEGFLSEIINAIPTGIFVTDLDHNILMINKAAAEMSGRSRGDCFDRKCHEVFNTFICKTDYCTCRIATKTGTVHHGISVMRINGKEVPIEYGSRPLKNIHGKTIGCVEHFMDITDRLAKEKMITEQHEQVLRLLKEKSEKNVELDRANAELFHLTQDLESLAQERTIIEMALEIADQIRNPAAAIGGLAGMLMKRLPADFKNSREFQALLDEVKKLEERVLNFEKLAQQQSGFFTREDLRNIVSEVLNTWSDTLAKKEIHLNIKKPAKPVNISANRRTLKVAIMHILRNALEISPPGEEIKIEISGSNGRPMVSITDHGSGIPKKIKEKLFAQTVTTKSKGIGIGLMLVKQILDEHQGNIEIESAAGKGTTVRLSFPERWEEKSHRICSPPCKA